MLVTDMGQLPASLGGQGAIGIDLETCDPDLKSRGPGPHRGGFICGVSIGTERGAKYYLPVGHETGPNLDRAKVYSWVGKQLKLPVPKIGARLVYDLGYLIAAGIPFCGPFYDVQVAEPLIDENKFVFSLNSIAREWLGKTKVEDELKDILTKRYGKKNPLGNIWRAHPAEVVAYTDGDVDLPLSIFPMQRKELESQNLWDLFIMESKLTEMLARMHLRGVRVDIPVTEKLEKDYRKEQKKLLTQVKRTTGHSVEVWAAASLARVFDSIGIKYPLTAKTKKPSFTAPWLEALDHPLGRQVRRIRWLDKMCGTFLQGCILEGHHRGRVHCQFNQLKSDEGGTVTGRFSSSLPNLQFIPMRTEEGRQVRSAFLPDEGQDWGKLDYSQIEYRLIVHDAACAGLPGAQDVVRRYVEDPDVDFHQVVADMTGLSRTSAKTINFGLAYGEGAPKLAAQLGLTLDEAEVVLRTYHRRAPFIRPLAQTMMGMASRDAEVRTLLNRKRRFNLWAKRQRDGTTLVLPHRFPGSQRAFTHKALNARIQGSAADIMKRAMVEVNESGVADVLGVPHLTVHDELDVSVPRNKRGREAIRELRHIMQDTLKLSVPLVVDAGIGRDWGRAEEKVA